MGQKQSPQADPGAADSFSEAISHACSGIGVSPTDTPPPDTRGHWLPQSERLNSTCAAILQRGGRFVAGLPFDAATLRDNGARYELLCGAEQTLLDALRHVRAAKEGVKRTIVDQDNQVLSALTCQAQDPRTSPEERAQLRALAAPALGLIQESGASRSAKIRAVVGRNAAFRATIQSLTNENLALRHLEDTIPPPAPKVGRRRSPR